MNHENPKNNKDQTALCDLAAQVSHRLNDEYRLQAEVDNSKIDNAQANYLSDVIDNLLPILNNDEDLTPPNNHDTLLHD